MRDMYHNILPTQILHPVNSTTAKTSSSADLQGFNGALVIFSIGQAADTLSGSLYWTLKIQHSDDDSTYTDVVLADIVNASTAATIVVDSSSEDRQAYSFGYNGTKRYLRAVATPTGTHTSGTPIGITALRGQAAYRPVQ